MFDFTTKNIFLEAGWNLFFWIANRATDVATSAYLLFAYRNLIAIQCKWNGYWIVFENSLDYASLQMTRVIRCSLPWAMELVIEVLKKNEFTEVIVIRTRSKLRNLQ